MGRGLAKIVGYRHQCFLVSPDVPGWPIFKDELHYRRIGRKFRQTGGCGSLAFRRRDRISLNHRTTAWLASYFDILFAANRRFNPSEKRLLTHAQALPTMPDMMVADLDAACTGACSLESCVADHLEIMRARLEHYLHDQGLL